MKRWILLSLIFTYSSTNYCAEAWKDHPVKIEEEEILFILPEKI